MNEGAVSGTPYSLTTLPARHAGFVLIGGQHGSIYASTSGGFIRR